MRNEHSLFPDHGDNIPEDDLTLLRSIISRRRTGRASANLSRRLLKRYGRIARVLKAPADELREVRGVDIGLATDLQETRRLMEALARADLSAVHVLEEPEAAFRFCRMLLAGECREQLHALYLDRSYRLLRQECLQTGTVDHVTVYPREVLGRAIQHSATAIILVHNHPSGNARPSAGDITMTRQLEAAALHLRIELADHIIVGGKENFSFRVHGLLPTPR
jgi:DNA repair protein RadC